MIKQDASKTKTKLTILFLSFLLIIVGSSLLGCSNKGSKAQQKKPEIKKGLEYTLDYERHNNGHRFKLNIKNMEEESKKFTFPTSQHFDYVIEKDNKKLWQWSEGQAFTQAQESITLAPKLSASYQVDWNGQTRQGKQAEPGKYLVKAFFVGVSKDKPVISKEIELK